MLTLPGPDALKNVLTLPGPDAQLGIRSGQSQHNAQKNVLTQNFGQHIEIKFYFLKLQIKAFGGCQYCPVFGVAERDFFILRKLTPRRVKEKKCANFARTFKFQLCNHTSPGTQMLCFHGSFLSSLQKKRRQIASWHRLWLELGRYLIAFEPLTFVLD